MSFKLGYFIEWGIGDPIILKVISKEGNDAVLNAVNTPARNGMYPLHLAAMNGYIKCVNQLVQAGAIVTARNQFQTHMTDIMASKR